MMHNKNQIRRTMWNKVLVAVLLGAVGWCADGVQAEINVTGPGNRGQNVVIPKKGPKPSPFTPRPRPFQSNGTFQTLDAEPGTGGGGAFNIIHPDPDDPSDRVFLDVTPSSVTLLAGASTTMTVTATFNGSPPPSSVRVFPGGVPAGLGITVRGLVSMTLSPSRRSRNFTVETTTSVPPGTYQFYVYGLTSENKYTEPAEYTLIVQSPPTPPSPTTTNSGVVTIINTLQSVIAGGTYNLDGDLQQVGALFDNENNHIVDVMPSSSSNAPFPRFPRFVGLGTWVLDVSRGYAGNGTLAANVIVSATVSTQQFVAAHLHVSNTGAVTPILLLAGDLNNPGVVMTANAFEVSVEGATPTAIADGFIRGVVAGEVFFLEPDGATIWSDNITFTFDVPLFND